MSDAGSQVHLTALLHRWSAGEAEALDLMVPLVYDDLRRIAHRRLSVERRGHTLDTTALVHEAYLRLADQRAVSWRDRAHFFAVASMAMRRVLVDYARARACAKRGAGSPVVTLQENTASVAARFDELLMLDEALTALGARDPRLQRVAEHRIFAGMSAQETAIALGTSLRTAERLWRRAKAYLFQELRGGTATAVDDVDSSADGDRMERRPGRREP